MKFNDVDVNTIHPRVSYGKEYLPGMPAREITTIDTATAELAANVTAAQDEYIVRLNIAAATYGEAEEAREAIAAWASASKKKTAKLEPHHAGGKYYDAIVKRIGRFEQRFGTLDVVFMLQDALLKKKTQSYVTGENGVDVHMDGTADRPFEVEITLSEAAEGLSFAKSYETFMTLTGSFAAGDVVRVNTETGNVIINRIYSNEQIDFMNSNPDAELEAGIYEPITCSAAGSMTVRWTDAWL